MSLGIKEERPAARTSSQLSLESPVLITGGAGFIGTNLAERLLTSGRRVVIYDNLSRPGVDRNIRWLRNRHGGDKVEVEIADICDNYQLRTAAARAKMVFHLAAQVAVTTSVADPVRDFETNLHGTLNLLEILRSLEKPPPLLFTSTNKVYGGLEDLGLCRNGTRYEPGEAGPHSPGAGLISGISENRPMRFQSPYGCSKGAADQYVLDYAGIYGLKAVVFRMSCIYGPHQFGTEDQGWIAHFLIRAIRREPLTVYGDGMQVRDVLFIDDLIDAFQLAESNIESISGEAFNIGGGAENSISIIELISLIREINGDMPPVKPGQWRPGDQKYYVTDFKKFGGATGWQPRTNFRKGILDLYNWLAEHRPEPLPSPGQRTIQ